MNSYKSDRVLRMRLGPCGAKGDLSFPFKPVSLLLTKEAKEGGGGI